MIFVLWSINMNHIAISVLEPSLHSRNKSYTLIIHPSTLFLLLSCRRKHVAFHVNYIIGVKVQLNLILLKKYVLILCLFNQKNMGQDRHYKTSRRDKLLLFVNSVRIWTKRMNTVIAFFFSLPHGFLVQ